MENQDEWLTKHFTLREMTRSATAEKLKIDNTPSPSEKENLRILCKELLEPLRLYLQQKIIVTSGFRCAELNAAVGGVKTSYHKYGMAADINVSGENTAKIAAAFLLQKEITDQVIYERKGRAQWLHVGWSHSPRHQYLKIIK